MRSLTAAETRVIHTLLVVADVSDRTRKRWAGVPRSTFQSIKRRAFDKGWLTSRLVPDPLELGFPIVEIALEQPFAEHRDAAVRRIRESPSTVFAWASPDSLLSVSFTSRGHADALDSSPVLAFRRRSIIRSGAPFRDIPVYFDWEGAWSTWASGLRPVTYPVGLAPRPTDERLENELAAHEGHRTAIAPLLQGPTGAAVPALGGFRHGGTLLPREVRRAIQRGWVTRRVFVELGEVPSVPERLIERVVFVTGRVKDPGISANELLSAIIRGSRARPLLLAKDSKAALIAFLSPIPEYSRSSPTGQASLVDTIGGYLREIEIVREPISTLFPIVNHRYNRPLEVLTES
jgi:hypothetical protein